MTPAIEHMLYGRYVFGVETGESGPYKALTPTQKICVWLRWLWGALCVSNCLLVWSIFDLSDGGGVLYDCFVFSAPKA